MTPAEFQTVLVRIGVASGRAETYAMPLLEAFKRAKINTPLRMGHALAQLLHESIMLNASVENLNYSAARLRQVFPSYFTSAQALAYAHKPERIANRVYANRMSNGPESSGDGWRFRGRGPLQITGKSNYTRLNAWLNNPSMDVLTNPDLLLRPEMGSLGFAWYWDSGSGSSLNILADQGDTRRIVELITKRVNGGLNGIEDRVRLFVKSMLYLRKAPTYRGDNLPL